MQTIDLLTNLPKTVSKRAKRVGRGLASGLGKTAGRGAKGQKKRGSIPASFEGCQLKLIKRLPYLRGVGNRSLQNKITLKLSDLNRLPDGAEVTNQTLIDAGIISARDRFAVVKIVSGGKLAKKVS